MDGRVGRRVCVGVISVRSDVMKILKVIIKGRLPKSCAECPYAIYDTEDDGYICYAMVVGKVDNLISDIHVRPEWCPLVVESKE